MIKHIVAGGCSFTTEGIGGIPPRLGDAGQPIQGGCSFNFDAQPQSWVGHVAQHLRVESLINVATTGHGNVPTAEAILHVLLHNNYRPAETMVLLNITETMRLDVMCSWNDPNRCPYIPWDSQLIPWTYHAWNSPVVKYQYGMLSNEDITAMSAGRVKFLFEKLQELNFDFRFMMMRDFTQDQDLAPIIDQYHAQAIFLPESPDMWGFCRQFGYLQDDRAHPDQMGHKAIAQQVLMNICPESLDLL